MRLQLTEMVEVMVGKVMKLNEMVGVMVGKVMELTEMVGVMVGKVMEEYLGVMEEEGGKMW